MKKETLDYNAMIIEDEKDLCFLLSLILKRHHFNVFCANSIFDGKMALKNCHPLILFLDNHLTDGSGIDFIIDIKKHSPYTKVVMITAHNSQNDKDRAIENGADYFISKPFDVATIINILERLRLGNTG